MHRTGFGRCPAVKRKVYRLVLCVSKAAAAEEKLQHLLSVAPVDLGTALHKKAGQMPSTFISLLKGWDGIQTKVL